MAADIRIAADDIKIGFNQVALAIMPAWGGAERLAALVGRGRAMMLAGSGAILTAAEAEQAGLVDRVLDRTSRRAPADTARAQGLNRLGVRSGCGLRITCVRWAHWTTARISRRPVGSVA